MAFIRKSKLRIRLRSDTQDLERVKFYIASLKKLSMDRGLQFAYYDIPGRPPSVNHYLNKGKHGNFYHTDATNTFYQNTHFAVMRSGRFVPTGVVAFIIVVESPIWVTKGGTLKVADIDNTSKVVLDALQKNAGIEDERAWEVHLFKKLGKTERTLVWCFDLGGIVDGAMI